MFSKLFQGGSSFYFAVYRVLAFCKDREQVLGCVYLLISCEQEWCFHGRFPGLSAERFCIQWENNTLALTQWSVSNHICLDNCFEMNFETLAGAHQKRKSWLMSESAMGQGRANLCYRHLPLLVQPLDKDPLGRNWPWGLNFNLYSETYFKSASIS